MPLNGTGARYGESVSTKILSLGIALNVEANSLDLLNVTTPLAEMKAFRSINFKAKSLLPVKQCIRSLKSFSFFFFLRISKVSFSADLV